MKLTHIMLFTILLTALVLLSGCGESPVPMSDAEAKVFEECLKRGHKPDFFANTSQRDIDCSPDDGMDADKI